MPRIIEYKVIAVDNAIKLERYVNEDMEKGWQPQGGAMMSVEVRKTSRGEESFHLLIQAMVKYQQ
jgi:hypothetical protein